MRQSVRRPARLVPLAFLVAILIGTALLVLPAARAGEGGAPVLVALFTATSAVCVTGLIVVDTSTYWSDFGQAVILGLIQVGGFGIMTAATLLGLLVTRRLRLKTRLVAQAETRTLDLGDVRWVLGRVAAVVLLTEFVIAVAVAARLWGGYHEPAGQALWHGVFHAVSAFNNAGFSTYSANLVGFAGDGWVIVPLLVAVVVGGIGFPVLLELGRRRLRRPASWSIHSKLTILGTAVLLAGGFVAVLVLEWTNPATLGPLAVEDKILPALTHGVVPRTAGFNSLDVGAMRTDTLAMTLVLMFIGGGSAGTAGGIKVTTFFLLAFVIWAEVRGNPDVRVFNRRVSLDAQRQALTVALLGVAVVAIGAFTVLRLTSFQLSAVLFECVSAFATVGLSTGITPDLPAPARLVIIILMYVGRVGTVTVATALALRTRRPLYRLPEERPIVG